ncbi:MAG: hypothetical protein ABIO21_04255, partial [Pseudomonas sp.]
MTAGLQGSLMVDVAGTWLTAEDRQLLRQPEVEQFITYPVERSLSNLPDITEMRSMSRFGLSVITIVFKESV